MFFHTTKSLQFIHRKSSFLFFHHKLHKIPTFPSITQITSLISRPKFIRNMNTQNPTPIIPRKKIKLSQLLRTAIEQRKKEKKLVYEGNDILPEYVQIAKELDAEYDMLLEELKDKIDDPDWDQYESEIHEAIQEIEKEFLNSTIPITAAYRQQIEDTIEAVVHKITQKWIFIFKERREKKERELYLQQINNELQKLKDKNEIEFIDKSAEQLLLSAQQNPTGEEAKVLAKINQEFVEREKKLVDLDKVKKETRLYPDYNKLLPYMTSDPEDKSTWAGADRILAHIEMREREKKFGETGHVLSLSREDFEELQEFFETASEKGTPWFSNISSFSNDIKDDKKHS